MKKIIFPLFLFTLIFSANTMAEPTKLIRVGIYQNEPKIFIDQNGNPAGIFVDFLNEIAKKEGWQLKYVEASWEKCMQALIMETIDLLPDVAFSVKRTESFDFNKHPVINSWSQVYARENSYIMELSDLEGKRIAILKGSIQKNTFEQMMKGFGYNYTAIEANSFDEAFSLTSKNFADAVIANNFYGESHYYQSNLIKTTVIFNPVSLHFVVKKGINEDILNPIDQTLDEWLNTPGSYYYKTVNRYHENAIMRPSQKSRSWTMALLLGLLTIAAGIIFLLKHRIYSKTKRIDNLEAELRTEENKFRNYVENAPIGVFVADANGRYIEANKAASAITGYSNEELIGKSISEIIPEDTHQAAEEHFKSVIQYGKASGVYSFFTKSSERRFWKVDAVKISNKKFIGFVNDITEQQRIAMELTELKEQLELQISEKTIELQNRIKDLEQFHEITIEREIRMKEMTDEIEQLKQKYEKD